MINSGVKYFGGGAFSFGGCLESIKDSGPMEKASAIMYGFCVNSVPSG